jgi:signal transduction histidine kinase
MPAGPNRYARALSAGLGTGAVCYALVSLGMASLGTASSLLPEVGSAGVLPPVLGVLLAAAGVLLQATNRRRRLWRIAAAAGFIALESGLLVVLLTLRIPSSLPHTTAEFGLSAMKTALVASCVNAGRRYGPALSATLAVLTSEALCIAVGVPRGLPWAPDVAELGALAVVLLASVGFAIGRTRAVRSGRRLAAAQDEETLTTTRAIARSRAAAVVHDTVLNDLAVLATSSPGPLASGVAQRLTGTLELLASPDWLRPPAEAGEGSSPLDEAVSHATASGLHVRLAGDLGPLRELEPCVATALGAAVEQCLSNTLRHAGTDTAEVTVLAETEGVSVMVSDAGSGFDADAVGADRLGLSASVRTRIEDLGGTVRIFTKPGFGTTVLLTVPRSAASLIGSGA